MVLRPEPRPARGPSIAATELLKTPISDPIIAGNVDGPLESVEPAPLMTKLTIRLDRQLLGRIRAAFVLEGLATGHTSLSGWVASVLADRVAAVETDRNNGIPLVPIGVDRIPKGRLR